MMWFLWRIVEMGIFSLMSNTSDDKTDNASEEKKVEAIKGDDGITIKDKEDKKIELKGSLSQVYTDALNEMYATENMGSMLNLTMKRDEEENGGDNELYVHIVDKDEIENGDLGKMAGELRIALDKKEYKKKMVVMEGVEVDHRVKVLVSYLTGIGVECITDRTTALETIKHTLKV